MEAFTIAVLVRREKPYNLDIEEAHDAYIPKDCANSEMALSALSSSSPEALEATTSLQPASFSDCNVSFIILESLKSRFDR